MKDKAKSKQQLIKELEQMRRQITAFSERESLRNWAEAAPVEGDAKYRFLVDNSYDLIWTLNADGVFTYVSPSWRRMLGYDESYMIGKAFQPFVHPDEVVTCEEYFHRVIHTKERMPGPEYRVKHADGTWRWHAATGTPVFGSDGTFISLVGISRDVTERRHAEEALKESKQQLSDIINFLPDATVVIDNNKKIIAWNKAMEDMTEVKKEDIIGQESYAGACLFYGEKRPFLLDLIDVSSEELQSKYHYVQRKGNTLYVETFTPALNGGKGAHVWGTGTPLFDVHGNRVGAIESIRDITERKRAGEALQRIQLQQEALLNNIPDLAWLKDKEGRFIAVNKPFAKSCGFKPEDLVGKTDLDIWPRDLAERYRSDDREVVESGKCKQVEEPLIDSEGRNLWIETIKTPIYNAQEEVTGTVGIARDFTERKHVEEALKESWQRFSDIINFLPDATLVIDNEGRVISWNRAIEKMTGIKAANILGKSNYEYTLPFYGERRPILIDLVLKPQEEIEAKYIITQRGDMALEGEAYMPDLRGGEAYLYGRASILRDSKGNIIGAIESIRDVTDRKLAENKYKGIFENAVMGIFHTTPDGRYLSSNPAGLKIYGYESAEDMIQSVTDMSRQIYVSPEDRARFMEIMESKGRIEGFETEHYRKDGSKIWTVLNSRVVHDTAGRTLYYETTIEDITKRKHLESQLHQVQKMEAIGTLAGGIAHDFNNILGAVIGYAEMGLRENKVSDRLRRYFEQIYKAGTRAGELVKQILTFSRRGEEKLYPLRISPIVKEVLKLLRASLPTTIEIHQKIQSDPDTILANPTHIHQILMNLCTNAAHAMGMRKGKLKIRLSPIEIKPDDALIHYGLIPGRHIKLAVSDTGHGIAPGIMDKIFDPFFTTKKPGEGTGMGLSVVHGIIKSCGGTIVVESEVGKGTEFNLYFPLLMETEGDPQINAEADIFGGEESILFVDDEEALVNLGKGMLAGLGYKVVGRTSSLEALELFRNKPGNFDIVITDMTMPNMTGIELAQGLILIRPDIPVILCTGFSDAITQERAKSMGIKEFTMKPLIQQQIAAAIRRVLDRKK